MYNHIVGWEGEDMYHLGTAAYYIDEEGRDHEIPMLLIDKYIAEGKYTVKVEGLEGHYDISHITTEPHTVHVYIAPKDAPSFPTHTDPYPVFIYCLEGVKEMEVDGSCVFINEGSVFKINANTPHRALNSSASVMLSIGLEDAA